jgi:ABC-2 type transport system permease protein
MNRIVPIFEAVTKNYIRSRAGLFFSLLFPLMLLLSLGSIFGGNSQWTHNYVPLLIGAFVMTNGIVGLPAIATEFRRQGVLKRLSATPLTKFEWIVGNVLSQAVLAVALSLVVIATGWIAFRVTVALNVYSAVILFAGCVLFAGMGMLIAGLIKDPEAANGLGNAIAFPMMFFSGVIVPLAVMPGYLQTIARLLPLFYFSDGLRASLVSVDVSTAITDLAVIAVLAVVFILLGSFVTRWREK